MNVIGTTPSSRVPSEMVIVATGFVRSDMRYHEAVKPSHTIFKSTSYFERDVSVL